jgi:cbb3-type cytochrome oxidase subunit 3
MAESSTEKASATGSGQAAQRITSFVEKNDAFDSNLPPAVAQELQKDIASFLDQNKQKGRVTKTISPLNNRAAQNLQNQPNTAPPQSPIQENQASNNLSKNTPGNSFRKSTAEDWEKAAEAQQNILKENYAQGGTPPRLPIEQQPQVADSMNQEKAQNSTVPPDVANTDVSNTVEDLEKKPEEENPPLVQEDQPKKSLTERAQDAVTEGVNSGINNAKTAVRNKVNTVASPAMQVINFQKIRDLKKDIANQQKQIKAVNKKIEPEQQELKRLKRAVLRALYEDAVYAIAKCIAKGSAAAATVIGTIVTIYYWIIKPLYLFIKFFIFRKGGKETMKAEKRIKLKEQDITKIEEEKKPIEQKIKSDMMQIRYLSQAMREPANDNNEATSEESASQAA